MGKVQKIRNEVERLQKELVKEKKKGFGSDVDDACILELQNILTYIDSLQEEPVNKDLEKAALFHYPKMSRISEPHDIIPADNESHYIGDANEDNRKAFKAGAKWQKEQMMTKSIEAVVSQVPCSNEIILYNPSSVDKYYLPQEMNKLGLNKGDKVKLVIIKED